VVDQCVLGSCVGAQKKILALLDFWLKVKNFKFS
jgi:hypothetical protein